MPEKNENITQLPIVSIEAETCGDAWEQALRQVWKQGIEVEQHYEDRWSKEATVLVNITNPLAEPRFSKVDHIATAMFTLNEEGAKPYRQKGYVREFLWGTLDDRVNQGVESYTYHERLFNYGAPQPRHEDQLVNGNHPRLVFFLTDPHGEEHILEGGIDQVELLLDKARAESISRKLQVTTWQPHKDLIVSGTPCLQRIWFRILQGRYLVCETQWRSRDLYKAFGPNLVAITEFASFIADCLNLQFTQLTDFSNSLHIYRSDYADIERFFKTWEKRRLRELAKQREATAIERAGRCPECNTVREYTMLRSGQRPEYRYLCANKYCRIGRLHPRNISRHQLDLECPYCGAKELDLVEGDAENPKALLYCFGCKRTCAWHQVTGKENV